MPLTSFYLHDLLGWTVTETVRLIGDRVHLQLGRVPSTGTGRLAARTVQDPSLPASFNQRHQVRSVTVRTETNQIPSMALRTFHTMANARHRNDVWRRGTPIVIAKVVQTMVGNNTHLTQFGHNHYDPAQ